MLNTVFVVLGVAILALVGWGAKDFFTAAEISIFIRVIVGVAAVAVVVLFGVVVRDRIRQARDEDFKGVDK